MRPKADPNRKLGSPVIRRFYAYLPPDGIAEARIRLLFHALWRDEEIGPEVEDAFRPIATSLSKSAPIVTEECQRLCLEFINTYFKVDNPSLMSILLVTYYQRAVTTEGGPRRQVFAWSCWQQTQPC